MSKSSGCTAGDLRSDPRGTSSSVALTLEPQCPHLSDKLCPLIPQKARRYVAALVATKSSWDSSVQIVHTQLAQEEELNSGQSPL